MNYNLQGFATGAGQFIVAFGLACLFIAVFKRIYQWTTPYDERALIGQGNMAAAIILGGAILGFALPVASSLEQTGSIVEFALWAVMAGVIQIIASLVMRRFIIADAKGQIESGNTATAIYFAATSIAVGMLNAASMTY